VDETLVSQSGTRLPWQSREPAFAVDKLRAWPEAKKRQARIEIIPMIDVMMFLLVFFVLISINVLPALGLKIKPPSSAKADQIVEKKRVMVSIDSEGQTFVDGAPVGIEAIPEKLTAAAALDPEKKLVVVIAGDEKASMQDLTGVLDALKIAGVGAAQITTRNK
jgi:biopolymer transport protein ExbD